MFCGSGYFAFCKNAAEKTCTDALPKDPEMIANIVKIYYYIHT